MPRQADIAETRNKVAEIEITPEMIEAGASAVSSFRDDLFGNGLVGFRLAQEIAILAYRAMSLAQPTRCRPTEDA